MGKRPTTLVSEPSVYLLVFLQAHQPSRNTNKGRFKGQEKIKCEVLTLLSSSSGLRIKEYHHSRKPRLFGATLMGLFSKLFGKKDKEVNKVKLSLIDYNLFFENKTVDNTPLELLNLGELNISTGQIIACDPLVCLYDTSPFTRRVPPGRYPVIACIAKTENSGDRYAIVKLEFSKEKATKWEMAVTEDEDIKELNQDDEFFGFPVDAGLGCFCDFETQQFYNQFDTDFMQRNPDGNIYDDYFAAEFKKNAIDQNDPQDIGDWLNFYLPNRPELNVIMFHSGYGDGMYPCYWGTNDGGKICSLIVDFQVLEMFTE